MFARTPIDPTSKVKSWTFHSFDKREVLSVLYRSVFVKAEMAILLSFGEVRSPQMIVREDTEAMTISGRCKVGTSVAGQTKEPSRSNHWYHQGGKFFFGCGDGKRRTNC